MGQILHGSATTTEAIRRAIQHSQESLRALANRYGINQKTVAKWKNRSSVADLPTGPKMQTRSRLYCRSKRRRSSSCLPSAHTLLPLDDCLLFIAGHYPTSHAIVFASLSAAPRHQLRLPDVEGAQADQEEVQKLPDRLLPYRHRRGPDRRRQALSSTSPSIAPRSSPSCSWSRRLGERPLQPFPGGLDRGCSLQDP